MSKIIIVPDDRKVNVNGRVAFNVSMEGVDPSIHAIFFNQEAGSGYIEYKPDPESGIIPPIEEITSFEPWEGQISEAQETFFCQDNPRTFYKTENPVGSKKVVHAKGWPQPEGYTELAPPDQDSPLAKLYWDGESFVWSVFPIDSTLSEAQSFLSNLVSSAAYDLLLPSDWMVVRESETGILAPQEWKDWRAAIRAEAEAKRASIASAKSLKELQTYSKSDAFVTWPTSPNG